MNDKTLFYVSRIVIVVPIVIILATFFLKVLKKDYSSVPTVISPTPISSSQPSYLDALKKIDLNGSYICHSDTGSATQSAYLQAKKLYVENQKLNQIKYYLYKDDCLYLWEKNIYSGQKICGLSAYINLLQIVPVQSLVNPQTASDYLQSIGISDINGLINSCKKREIKDTAIFEIPRNILFKNKQLK